MAKQPKTSILTITPKLAAKWLGEKNPKNRNIKMKHVRAIARDIKNGRWEFNGESISFDVDGNLMDGQHRLTACILAGEAILSLVVYNVPRSARRTIGSSKVRTLPDVQACNGKKKKNAAQFNAAAMLLAHYDAQRFSNFMEYSQTEKLEILDAATLDGLSCVVDKICARNDGIAKKSWLMAAAHIVGKCYPNKKDEIVEKLATGEMIASHEPVYRLRAWVAREKMGGGNDCRSIGFYTALKMLEMQAKGAHASRVTIAREAFKVGK